MVPLMKALDVVGSDVDHHECPRCGSHDRERHLLLYMRASGILPGLRRMRVLHFAPEKWLSRAIVEESPVDYVRCDLHPQSADIQKVDMLDMPFDDGFFDLVIANHVLEHVEDDLRAVREVHRVLNRGGRAILQVPYSSVLTRTWSDPGIVAERLRKQAFGQEDHVRMFGRDVCDRISSSGLVSEVVSHEGLLGDVDAMEVGVNPEEPFFLFRKP